MAVALPNIRCQRRIYARRIVLPPVPRVSSSKQLCPDGCHSVEFEGLVHPQSQGVA